MKPGMNIMSVFRAVLTDCPLCREIDIDVKSRLTVRAFGPLFRDQFQDPDRSLGVLTLFTVEKVNFQNGPGFLGVEGWLTSYIAKTQKQDLREVVQAFLDTEMGQKSGEK